MERIFYSTFPGTRPVISDESTREFAWESLHAKYGRETEATPNVSMDATPGFSEMKIYEKYDAMITKIASDAPLRFAENELLCGSATLGDAVSHMIPASFEGKLVMGGISHLTSGFERLLREGLDSYGERICRRMENETDGDRLIFLRSLQNVIRAIHTYHERYMSALAEKLSAAKDESEKLYFSELIENLREVPFKAPRSFRQALQSLWFTFSFLRLCGCWPGIGRLDVMLGRFLDGDLNSGAITEDFAYRLLAHFFIKGCEWIRLDSLGSGDAQHYQNIVLGGVDENGDSVVNRVTYLTLRVVEEFPISDFPIALRVNSQTPDDLLGLIARVMRHGSGVAAVYNDSLIIDSLVEFGYPLKEARGFANDGCWEVQIPGKTAFTYCPNDMYPLLENEVLNLRGDSCPEYADFEELYAALIKAVKERLDGWNDWADGFAREPYNPKSVVALFCDDCIENAADYMNRGPRYTAVSYHFGGVPDVGDCLFAIKKNVYDEKRYTLPQLRQMLIDNWAGHEEQRRQARFGLTYYGNDDDEADSMVTRIMDDYMNLMRRVKSRAGVLRPAGISTFGRQIEWAPGRMAGADGGFAGEIRASNLCPTPGTDISGATAVIKSHCKVDLKRLTCGTALDLKLDPSSVRGDAGIGAIVGLIRSFVRLGGFFMQIDVLDNAVLLEAQKHPENYPNLSVRISGWSARFVTLDEHWQQMIIERSTQK